MVKPHRRIWQFDSAPGYKTYRDMIRQNYLADNLKGLIGWRKEPYSGISIPDSMEASSSGLFFQDVHPLVTLQNLSCVAPDFRNMTLPVGVTPDDAFAEWLQKKTESLMCKAVNMFYNERMAKGFAKDLCENRMFFDGAGRLVDKEPNRNNVVGLELVPIRSKGVTTVIKRVGLQFSHNGTYTLYLLHTNSVAPVKVASDLAYTKAGGLQWFELENWVLPYNEHLGGSYYMCYAQSQLPDGSQAIYKDRDWSKAPCRDCSRNDYASWLSWSKYLEVHPFYMNEEKVDFVEGAPQLWNVGDNFYNYSSNYGLNVEITVQCDITDFIVEQKNSLVDYLSKSVVLDLLKEMMYNANARTNRHVLNVSKLDIANAIDGDPNMLSTGLKKEFEVAYKALSLNLAGIDRVCLPCKNGGVKYRTT